MLGDALELIYVAPWTVMLPGRAIMMSVLLVNLLGDGIRRAINAGGAIMPLLDIRNLTIEIKTGRRLGQEPWIASVLPLAGRRRNPPRAGGRIGFGEKA